MNTLPGVSPLSTLLVGNLVHHSTYLHGCSVPELFPPNQLFHWLFLYVDVAIPAIKIPKLHYTNSLIVFNYYL